MSVLLKFMLSFFLNHLSEFYIKLYEQLSMVAGAIFFATFIGVPLGIIAVRKNSCKNIILGLSGTLQIIPGLALLALLIPLFGIGIKTATIALIIYALLPIVSNTVAGISTIPQANIEAADALGFTNTQRLWMIELPLALATIIAGIRIATTLTVATATLAAFIGAGGLGDFINRGLALNDTRYLLLGAIPAGLLALILDFFIRQIEKSLKQRRLTSRKKISLGVIILLVPAILWSPNIFNLFSNSENTIRIATTNFTEQFILGEIISQLIESKTSLKVKRYFNFGTSELCFAALKDGEIDIYPAYTDIAFLTTLHEPYIGIPRKELFAKAQKAYLERFSLLWLAPFGFNDSQSLAVREAFAKQKNIYSISQLASLAKELTIAAPSEFTERLDGMPGLTKAYNLQFKAIKEMEPTLMYEAIHNKQVDVIMAFTTDGRIPTYHLTILKDDKQLFPSYDCAPLIRLETLKKHPELKEILSKLSGKIDDATMQHLNAEVDLQKRTPFDVAHEFICKDLRGECLQWQKR